MTQIREFEPEELGIGRFFYSMRDAIIVASAVEERIHFWNPAAAILFGYTEAQAKGMSLDKLVPEALRSRHRAGLRKYAQTGAGRLIDSHSSVELPALRADGSEITVELTLTPINDAFPEHRFVAAFVRDVTKRKHLEQEREHFIAMVAHDIMSPLTVVSGMADLLARKELDDQARVMLAAIDRNADKALQVTRDLTETASIESGRFTLRTGTFDLCELVSTRVTELAVIHPGRRLSLETQESVGVVGDELRTTQVLGNLLGNALKFSDDAVAVSVFATPTHGRVTITDQGPGIEEGAIDRMFDKFTRGHESHPGSGLGLYISRLLMEAQNGAIGAIGHDAGKGVTFWFELPLDQASPA